MWSELKQKLVVQLFDGDICVIVALSSALVELSEYRSQLGISGDNLDNRSVSLK